MEKEKRKKTRYQPIETSIWNDFDFRQYEDSAKVLWFYLLTCPHSNMLGFYRLPIPYALHDLKWLPERLGERLGELLADGKIEHDENADLILVKNHLKHRPLDNQNQVIAAIDIINRLPITTLFKSFSECLKRYDKPHYKPLHERLAQRLQEPLPKRLPKPYSKPDSRYPLPDNRQPSTEDQKIGDSEKDKEPDKPKPKSTFGLAVDTYRDILKLTPNQDQRDLITNTVGARVEAWSAVLTYWKTNNYSPKNISGMLKRFEEQNGKKPAHRSDIQNSGDAWEAEIAKGANS